MRIACVLLLLAGAGLMACSLVRYAKTLRFIRNMSYEESDRRFWMHIAAYVMIGFFFVGYLLTAVSLLVVPVSLYVLLISLFFLVGSLFVFCMVKSTESMSEVIAVKTHEIIQTMIDAMEAKDLYTQGHSVHVMELSLLLYEALPPAQKCTVNREMLRDAALLHDIGKLRIPDSILNKPGRLSDEEMAMMREHPKHGFWMLDHTSYRKISEWVLYHHERMDGKGYYGLAGEKIPLESRILAVADTFSALYTDRVYHGRLDYDCAIAILREAAGTQLDPDLVDLFCTIDRAVIDKVTP